MKDYLEGRCDRGVVIVEIEKGERYLGSESNKKSF